MKKGSSKTGSKYKSKKKVGNRWVYDYEDKKPKKTKSRIDDYYGKGRHKYFESEKVKKDFIKDSKKLVIKKEIKITSNRLKKNTEVKLKIKNKEVFGKIIATDGTKSKSPTHFDVEYSDEKGKKKIKKNIPREKLSRKKVAWSSKSKAKKHVTKIIVQKPKEKKLVVKKEKEVKVIIKKDKEVKIGIVSEKKIQKQARELVMKDWKLFSKMIGTYYNKRVKGGWNAESFGFSESDLKQEAYIVLQNSAMSYLRNPKINKEISFVNYAKSFLKSNLASKLAAGSGAGGHLKASAKDQMYLMFYQKVLSDYKSSHKNMMPSDDKMMKLLNDEKDKLKPKKGNMVIKNYDWTLEKVGNKKRMSRKMTNLDSAMRKDQPDSGTILDILNDKDLESFGKYYRIDPWEEAQKKWIRDSVTEAIERKFPLRNDREILIRSYGLFVNPESSPETRSWAGGQRPTEIAKVLNNIEREEGSLKRWNGKKVDDRLNIILGKMRKDEEFKRAVEGFMKAEVNEEWNDVTVIAYWMLMYKISSEVLDGFLKKEKKENKVPNLVLTRKR